MAFSETQNCDIVLANDPDADRLAVAERDRTTGIWTVFSGDQIGTMLGLWIWERLGKNSNKVRFWVEFWIVCYFDMRSSSSSSSYCVVHAARFHVPLDGIFQNVGRNWESRGILRRGDFDWVQMDRISIRRTKGRRLLPCLWLRGGDWICMVRYWQKYCSFADNLIPNHILTIFWLFDR